MPCSPLKALVPPKEEGVRPEPCRGWGAEGLLAGSSARVGAACTPQGLGWGLGANPCAPGKM